jgi:hypothetical protein
MAALEAVAAQRVESLTNLVLIWYEYEYCILLLLHVDA